ncbi:MAG TPA: hypothetical protein VNP73_03560 [Actinomycetota bacterium]|nr:hypothetical protein [Actinomycetota bacterium]
MKLISPHRNVGRWVVVPPGGPGSATPVSKQQSQRRRKFILLALLSFALATGIWSLVTRGDLLELHLVADAGCVFYASLLLDAKRRRVEHRHKVRKLPRPEDKASDYFEVIEAGGTRNA